MFTHFNHYPINDNIILIGVGIWGGTTLGLEEARWRRAGDQDWRYDPPLGPEETGIAVEAGRGGGVVLEMVEEGRNPEERAQRG